MKVIFLQPAEQELNEAVEHYSLLVPGLGEKFLNEIELTLSRIKSFPKA